MKKVVLAYSGGLDTSFCVKFLGEEKGMEVDSVLVVKGGFTDAEIQDIEKKAYELGVKSHYTARVADKYYKECIKYFAARIVLWGSGHGPENYQPFFAAFRTYRILEQRSTGHAFLHDVIVDYLADSKQPVIKRNECT